jgi:hypothetical protein
MSSALLQIETEIAERLESIPFFEPYATRGAILVEPRKNILAEINKKLGQLQTVIVPKIVGADDLHPNVNGAYFDAIRISVGVFQKDLLKGSDAGYIEIAEEIHKALKWWTPDSLVNAINPSKPGIEIIADTKLNIAACNFETKGGFVGTLPRVATPTGSQTDTHFSLACATAGAAIFYTTNGANPIPRTATLYTAPVVITGATVKARAFLAGYLRSELLTANYQQS